MDRLQAVILLVALVARAAAAVPADSVPAKPGGSKPSWDNSLGMRFVAVPETGVRFSIWETRDKDYRAFAESTQRKWPKPPPFINQSPEVPAVNVSWTDATAFCQWLTAKERAEGRIGGRELYRLPTDGEWSRAVGIGPEQGATPAERQAGLKTWPWGGVWPPPRSAGNYFDLACKKTHRAWSPDWGWYIIEGYDDGFSHLAPVGSFPPNALGIHDLGGNVWEWCSDREDDQRILRGAGWYDSHPVTLLSACRNRSPGDGSFDIGFRVVLANEDCDERPAKSVASKPQASKGANAAAASPMPAARPSVDNPSRDMVLIEGGTFEMGDALNENPSAWAKEIPVHTVQLGAFALSRYEVTVEQFRAFAAATGYVTDAEKEDGASAWVTWDNDTKGCFAPWSAGLTYKNPGFRQSDTDPAVCLSWNDAVAYCNWLSRRQNLSPAYDTNTAGLIDGAGKPAASVRPVKGYRLPTEAEWEYAAREKGRKVRFGNGKDVARAEEINFYASQGNYFYAEKGIYRKRTLPVGSFPANALGLFDMSGNAWEWCSDCCADYLPGTARDPYVSTGPNRIVRGGRWGGGAKEIRGTARHFEAPNLRCNNSGFRVAKTVDR